jgi:serine/threonine protein kinase
MNIFIDDENIAKIGDLGIARFMSNKNENVEQEILDKEKVIKFETYTKHRGTDGYIAPEQVCIRRFLIS